MIWFCSFFFSQKFTKPAELVDVITSRSLRCVSSAMLVTLVPSFQPVQEICERVKALNGTRQKLRILLHTDAAQALGKIPVSARHLGVDFLTIVGHKVWKLPSKRSHGSIGARARTFPAFVVPRPSDRRSLRGRAQHEDAAVPAAVWRRTGAKLQTRVTKSTAENTNTLLMVAAARSHQHQNLS